MDRPPALMGPWEPGTGFRQRRCPWRRARDLPGAVGPELGSPNRPKARIRGKVTHLLGSETRKAVGQREPRAQLRGRRPPPAPTGACPGGFRLLARVPCGPLLSAAT